MSLPVLNAPVYSVKLFSQKTNTEFRPYLVKEEKLLLMAQQSDDEKEIRLAVGQLIAACSFGKLNVNTLPSFDIEMMLLQLRARSVNNVVDVRFICRNKVATENGQETRCGQTVPFAINIDDIKLVVPEGHTNKVWLTDDLGVIMKYPTATIFDIDRTQLLEVIPACLEQVFTKAGQVHEVAEQKPEDIKVFVESLTVPQVEKIRVFFETMPRLEHRIPFKCPKCGHEDEIVLSGLMDFFG